MGGFDLGLGTDSESCIEVNSGVASVAISDECLLDPRALHCSSDGQPRQSGS